MSDASLPTADEAARALAAAGAASREMATSLRLPRFYSLITGTCNALFTYGIALGNSDWALGQVAFMLSLVALVGGAYVARRQFTQLNGAWVSGVSGPRATWRVIGAFLLVLVACVVGAVALMVAGHPLLSAGAALSALPLTAVADRWWMAAYRKSHAASA